MTGKVPGYGPSDARIMVVGEAPGAQEVQQGRPFVGPAGQLLRGELLRAGIDPEKVYFSNICKFQPPGNDLAKWADKPIPDDVVLDGLLELQEEVNALNPNVIVACGNWPLRFLTGKTGITNYRGSILEGHKGFAGRKVVATYHPSFIQRGMWGLKPVLCLDLKRALSQSAFPEIRRLAKNLALDPQGADRRWWRDRLLSDMSKTLSFDIEYWNNELKCVGMTTSSDEAVSFWIRNAADVDLVREILTSGIGLCAQNAMFDCSILEYWYHIPCLRYLRYDTMVAAHATNVEFPKGLDFLCSIYTEQPYYKDMIPEWKIIAATGDHYKDKVLEYNCIDTWVTHEIMERQLAEDLTDPLYRKTFEFEMSLINPLWDMSLRGVRIDTGRMKSLKDGLQAEANDLQEQLDILAGGECNVKSGPQVGALLFESLGIKAGRRTPGGLYKTDDETLADCLIRCTNERQRWAINLIRDIRERRDLISKFCEIDLDYDGRMRCHYDPAKTETGRLSSRKFYPTGRGTNLQNPPRDKRVRSVFIPDDGMEIGNADLKGAEFLVVAELTQDYEMLRLADMTIRGVGDVHKETAAFILGIPLEEVDSPRRYLGKKVRHSSNYMIGPRTLMSKINAEANVTGVTITQAEAKDLLHRYYLLHPGLAQWWNRVRQTLVSTRTITNRFGRKRVFHGSIDAILPVAVAQEPQSTIADCLNIGLLRCAHDSELAGLGFQLLLQVHDSITFQYPRENRDAVLRRVRGNLDVPIDFPETGRVLRVPVEIAAGPSWGECEVWAEDLKEAS